MLPHIAFCVLPVDPCQVISVHKGLSGYVEEVRLGTEDEARSKAKALNAIFGVTPSQAQAMRAGSMFGWDCPAADPDSYNEDGSFRRCEDDRNASE